VGLPEFARSLEGGEGMRATAVATGLMLWAAIAQAQVYDGNDTGGIISWSCETEAMAQQIAADYCARWNKYHRITSVHRQYGDYIGFVCLWSPYVNPYALPAVPTRSSCAYERPWRLPLVIDK
jgi:hypothetical protein